MKRYHWLITRVLIKTRADLIDPPGDCLQTARPLRQQAPAKMMGRTYRKRGRDMYRNAETIVNRGSHITFLIRFGPAKHMRCLIESFGY